MIMAGEIDNDGRLVSFQRTDAKRIEYGMMANVLLSRIALRNFLSFGNAELELGPLNVIIGPNGSGKSNLIESIALLKAAPMDLNRAIARGGGASAWNRKSKDAYAMSTIECDVQLGNELYLKYLLQFRQVRNQLSVELEEGRTVEGEIFQRAGGTARFVGVPGSSSKGEMPVNPTESFFSVYKSPSDFTPITEVGAKLSGIRIYRRFNLDSSASMRNGVLTSASKEFLEEDGSNLPTFLSDLDFRSELSFVNEFLHELSERFEWVKPRLEGSYAQLFLQERNLSDLLPAARISDGTLQFICLIAILVSTRRPSLICIEEPELGLHPDAMASIACALKKASKDVQLIVSTHSEALVSSLSDQPESIIVCEQDGDSGSQLKRLSADKLADWLDEYTLGELWRKGEIGGNRW